MRKEKYISLGNAKDLNQKLIVERWKRYDRDPTEVEEPLPEDEIIERDGKLWILLIKYAEHFKIHPEVLALDFVLSSLNKEIREFETNN